MKATTVGIFDNLTRGTSSRGRFARAVCRRRSGRSANGFNRRCATFKPDAVMHFAANALVGESMENPSKYFRNNIGNGLNLLDAMVATGVKQLRFFFDLRDFRTAGTSADRRDACRNVRSIRMANRNWPSKKSCAGTTRFMVCVLSRCVISTLPALRKISAKNTAPKRISFRMS